MVTEERNASAPPRAAKPAKPKPARKEAKHGRLAIFPAAAVNDSRISPDMLAVLAALSCHSSRSGFIDVSHNALAARLGKTRQYVQRTLATLERLGYLRSARRRRQNDYGETSKAYRLELDYQLPVQYWRYVPTDYGSEPEEVWPDDLLPTLPPATIEVAPPASPIVAPPASPIVAPPASPIVAPRTIGINDRIVDGVLDAHTRDDLPEALPENPPADLLQQIARAAHLPPATNLEALAALLARYAATLTPDDLLIAASDCAQWYAQQRATTPRLGNLSEWLRREQKRRQLEALEALEPPPAASEEEATTDATTARNASNATHAARSGGASASAANPERGRSTRPTSRASRVTRQTRGGSAGAEAWQPGHRVWIPDDGDYDSAGYWTLIDENGKRWRYLDGKPCEPEEPTEEQPEEPAACASASGSSAGHDGNG